MLKENKSQGPMSLIISFDLMKLFQVQFKLCNFNEMHIETLTERDKLKGTEQWQNHLAWSSFHLDFNGILKCLMLV